MASSKHKTKGKSGTLSCTTYVTSNSKNEPKWIDNTLNNIEYWKLDDEKLRVVLLKLDIPSIAKICKRLDLPASGKKKQMVNLLVENRKRIAAKKKKKETKPTTEKKKLLGEYEFGKEYAFITTRNIVKWYRQKYRFMKALGSNDNKQLLASFEETVGFTLPISELAEMEKEVKSLYGFDLALWSVDSIADYTGASDSCETLRGSLRSTGDKFKTPARFFTLGFMAKTFKDYTKQINQQIKSKKINGFLQKKINSNVFHGIGGVNRDFCIDLFKQFDETKPIKWAGPISTTTSKEIATTFADKGEIATGIILELMPNKDNFGIPVELLSTQSYGEQEILFFGAEFTLLNVYLADFNEFVHGKKRGYIKLRKTCMDEINVWPENTKTDVIVLEAVERAKGVERFRVSTDDAIKEVIYKCLKGRFYAYEDQTCWKQKAPISYKYFQEHPIGKQKVYANYIDDDVAILMLLGAMLIFLYCISCLFGMVCGYFGGKGIKKHAKASLTKNHREII